MTNQYEEESSSRKLRTLATKLIEIRNENSITQEDFILGYGLQRNIQENLNGVANIIYHITNDTGKKQRKRDYEVLFGDKCEQTKRKGELLSPQKDFWLEAERNEIDSINKKKDLQAAQLPRGKKFFKTKWVYRVKYGATGEFKSNKDRLVACGYALIFGDDFDETYSLVIRLTSLKLLFANSAQLGLIIHQLDVNTAFLHADIQEEIYIKPPEGMPLPEVMNCFRLKKSLYGLKQSPRE